MLILLTLGCEVGDSYNTQLYVCVTTAQHCSKYLKWMNVGDDT